MRGNSQSFITLVCALLELTKSGSDAFRGNTESAVNRQPYFCSYCFSHTVHLFTQHLHCVRGCTSSKVALRAQEEVHMLHRGSIVIEAPWKIRVLHPPLRIWRNGCTMSLETKSVDVTVGRDSSGISCVSACLRSTGSSCPGSGLSFEEGLCSKQIWNMECLYAKASGMGPTFFFLRCIC